ncbi:MAG TPA: ribosome maturation factor RimP [Gammaproteobacteria bacterium]|jgi:ribosome maturation factor RimP|nr:ribosome maturation factor RimP [Gammaproteobacteria bacterium]
MGQAVDKERLIELLEPAVAALGYELTDLDAHAGRRGLLRLYIGRKEGITTLEDCERVSEQVGAFLDVEDPLPGSYVLEVSSPGLDRRLRTLEHFERFKGEPVKVELKDARDGRRRLSGRLEGVEAGEVLVTVDGEIWRLALQDIAVARLVPRT